MGRHRAEGSVRPEHIKRFVKLARQMAKLLEEVRKDCPEANMYLEDSGNWLLLTGDSHDDEHGETVARQDRKVAFALVPHSGGGAW